MRPLLVPLASQLQFLPWIGDGINVPPVSLTVTGGEASAAGEVSTEGLAPSASTPVIKEYRLEHHFKMMADEAFIRYKKKCGYSDSGQ